MGLKEKILQKEKIMELKEQIVQEEEKLQTHKKLLDIFPDLSEDHDRWGNVRLKSKSINEQADKVFMNHNCGCCDDSPLQAWPYKEFHGVNIFSDPACFMVGISNYGACGDIEDYEWETKLRDKNISEVVIEKVKEYFKENPVENWD